MQAIVSPYLRLSRRFGMKRCPSAITDNMLKRLGLDQNSRLLDLGCGAGYGSSRIAKTYGCEVVGVDFCPEVIERAYDMHKREPYFGRLKFLVGDILELDFRDSSFDVVLCESVLLFIEDKARAFWEMTRLLKGGGFLALNELCQNVTLGSDATKDFLSRPEIGGFLVPAQVFLDHCRNWPMILIDEYPFDVVGELKAEVDRWSNFKALTLLLEASFDFFTDKDAQKDFLAVLALMKDMPRDISHHLNTLTMVVRKNL